MPSWSTDACPSGAFSVVQRSFGWQFLWRNWWCFPWGFGGTLFQTIWDDDEATSRTLLLKTLLLWLLDICFCGLIPLKPVFFFALAARAVGYRQLNHLTFSLLVKYPRVCWSLELYIPPCNHTSRSMGGCCLSIINTYGELGITTIMTMKVE